MYTLDKVRSALIELLYRLIFKKSLKKKKIKAISYFIWSLDYFGVVGNDAEVRIRIEINNSDGTQELVLRINEDLLWLGVEGIWRSNWGSDSYETVYFIGFPDGTYEEILEDSSSDERLNEFIKVFEEVLLEDRIKLDIEYWGKYKTV